MADGMLSEPIGITLFIKFSQMNNCTDEHLRKFDEIVIFPKSCCFTFETLIPIYIVPFFILLRLTTVDITNDTDRFSQAGLICITG